jgi:GT2 family glycosyltransferase
VIKQQHWLLKKCYAAIVMNKDFTSVIIVNYNTKELTADCIRSVQKYFTPFAYEIIVVDNASSDGSVPYLEKLFPGVGIIANERNIGFGSANNEGAKKATGEFIFLLNSDTIITENILTAFVDFYNKQRHLKIGVLGSLMISEEHKVIHSLGPLPKILGRFIQNGQRKKNSLLIKEIEENYFAQTDTVVGANMFMEKKVFDLFDGFDENIFLYEEEMELQYRMKKAGYASVVINEKSIIHLEGKSSESYFRRKCSFLSLCYIYGRHLPCHLYLYSRVRMTVYALFFFKNSKTTWKEKINYLSLTIFKK